MNPPMMLWGGGGGHAGFFHIELEKEWKNVNAYAVFFIYLRKYRNNDNSEVIRSEKKIFWGEG